MRYLRHKDKKENNLQSVGDTEELTSTEDIPNQIVASQDETCNGTESSESYQMDALLYLKTAIVNDENMPKIKEILKRTVDRRWNLLNTENVNMLEHFPGMFVHPPLVSQFNFI